MAQIKRQASSRVIERLVGNLSVTHDKKVLVEHSLHLSLMKLPVTGETEKLLVIRTV